jgi:radical SAM protein with 4Fe4S-binding SPASM domain
MSARTEVAAGVAHDGRRARVKACRDPWEVANVRANGDVLPCCHSLQRMGNLNEATLEEIWRGPRYESFRKLLASPSPLPCCRTCFVRGWRPARRVNLAEGIRRLLCRDDRSAPAAATPHLRLNGTTFRVGEQLTVEMGLSVRNPHRCPIIDIYLAASPERGDGRTFVHMNGRFSVLTSEALPLIAEHSPIPFAAVEVFDFEFPPETAGSWTLTAFTVPAKSAPDDRSTWLGDSSVAFAVATEPPAIDAVQQGGEP